MRFINCTGDFSSSQYVLRPMGSSPVLKKPSPPTSPTSPIFASTSSLPAAYCPPAPRILMPSSCIKVITTARNTPAPAKTTTSPKMASVLGCVHTSPVAHFGPSPLSPNSKVIKKPSFISASTTATTAENFEQLPKKKSDGGGVSSPMRCNFCRKNGEPVSSYSSHRLHNEDGTTQCPILRSLVCKICGDTGENAHTISYCPYAKSLMPIIEESLGEGEARLNMGDLRMTRFSAAGKRQKKFAVGGFRGGVPIFA